MQCHRLPAGDEQRRHHRADDDAAQPQRLDPAQSGDQHQPVGNTRVPPDEDRTQDIVRQADHQHPRCDHYRRLPDRIGGEQIDRYRTPDDRRPDRGQQRRDRHQHAP